MLPSIADFQCLWPSRYDEERAKARRGVGIVPPEERRQAIGMKRSASVERVEHDNAVLKQAHMQSVREHLLELRAAQQASSGRTAAMVGAARAAVIAVDVTVEAAVEAMGEAVVEATGSGLPCSEMDRDAAEQCAAEQAWKRGDASSSGHATKKVAAGGGGGGASTAEFWTSCLHTHYPLELRACT